MVEIDGGGGLVEQRATQAAGTSVAPCTTQPSSEWYLAEGFTAENSTEQLVLTNPYDQSAIVDIGFATADGVRGAAARGPPRPGALGEVIDMDAVAARGRARGRRERGRPTRRDRRRAGAAVRRRRATRLQHDARRAGAAIAVVVRQRRSRARTWCERFSLYNPTETDVEVTPLFLGIAEAVPVDPIAVPAREVVTFSSDGVAGLPDGRHAVVFATADSSDSIVVERAITRTIDEIPTTSVLPGATARPEDAFVPTTWTFAIGPGEPTEAATRRVQQRSRARRHRHRPGRHRRTGSSIVPGLDERQPAAAAS